MSLKVLVYGHMKQIYNGGELITILSHAEKAKELGISTRTLSRWKLMGKLDDMLITIPRYLRPFYLSKDLVERNSISTENNIDKHIDTKGQQRDWNPQS